MSHIALPGLRDRRDEQDKRTAHNSLNMSAAMVVLEIRAEAAATAPVLLP